MGKIVHLLFPYCYNAYSRPIFFTDNVGNAFIFFSKQTSSKRVMLKVLCKFFKQVIYRSFTKFRSYNDLLRILWKECNFIVVDKANPRDTTRKIVKTWCRNNTKK